MEKVSLWPVVGRSAWITQRWDACLQGSCLGALGFSQGENEGLCGESATSLAIWLAERAMVAEDIIFHECGVKFPDRLFQRYLPEYTQHQFFMGTKRLSVSPHHFGWPCHRPRLWTVLTKDSSCFMNSRQKNLKSLAYLFRQPILDCSVFFCAPRVPGLAFESPLYFAR